mmetsp:Transcript_23241/g.65852  ORF Transcript_23241/g.65852 Transcript_23241/m.65852 type:complete len:174 (-) Transcript_23241:144-665(-)
MANHPCGNATNHNKTQTTKYRNPARARQKKMPLKRNAKPVDMDRQLMIKTKACERLVKEVAYYEKEVKENEATLAKMKADGKDPYDIKKFEEVLGESYMMIPNSNKRLQSALEDLLECCSSPEIDDDKKSGEWYTKAQDVLRSRNMLKDSAAASAGTEAETTDLSDLKDGEAF